MNSVSIAWDTTNCGNNCYTKYTGETTACATIGCNYVKGRIYRVSPAATCYLAVSGCHKTAAGCTIGNNADFRSMTCPTECAVNQVLSLDTTQTALIIYKDNMDLTFNQDFTSYIVNSASMGFHYSYIEIWDAATSAWTKPNSTFAGMFTNGTSATLAITSPSTPFEMGLTQFRATIVSFTCASMNKRVRQAESLDLIEDRL